MTRVLIVDREISSVELLKQTLEAKHLWVIVAEDKTVARELLARQFFHACLWPLSSSDALSEVHELKNSRPLTSVIVTGQNADPSFVVDVMRAGASHFIADGSDVTHASKIILDTLARSVPSTEEDLEAAFPIADFIGRHPKILEIFRLIQSIKDTDSTVLITGESGTGKEVVARAIHQISSRRRGPWVAVNCSAIPANLLESELFGHVKGAFTGATQNRPGRFQLAGAGTLFLDEIGDLSFDLQAKLLRAIQHRTYEPVGSAHSLHLEARIIAATNQDLETAVVERKFREDLFYRLNVIPIYIPPLRSRRTDIPLLVRCFLERFCKVNNKPFHGISEEAMRCLVQYHWPGNVRELENLMERVIVLKRAEGVVELSDIPIQNFRNVRLDRFVANVALPEDGVDFNQAVNEFENELIFQALQRTDGNKNKAATLLNLNRTTLVEKLKRKGIRIGL